MEAPEIVKNRRSEGREKQYHSRRVLVRILEALIVLAVLFTVFFYWLFPIRITGDSMDPALSDGEIILCDRLARYWKLPGRGDLIAFTTAEGYFIKRIVALPGERVEIVSGQVFINSVPLDEHIYAHDGLDTMLPKLVPYDSVFVLGDNRIKVYDSRLDAVGCIPYSEIVGIPRVRISPISRWTIFF